MAVAALLDDRPKVGRRRLPDGRVVDFGRIAQLPEGEQVEFWEFMAALEAVYESNPLERFFPHSSAQSEFLAAQSPVVALFAGNQFGKTASGVVKDLIDALRPEDVPEHLRAFKKWQPPFFCRIIAPSQKLLEQSIFPTIQQWCPSHALFGGSWDKAFKAQKNRLDFACGSQFDFMTYEMASEGPKAKFGSVRLHRVHYDEEPPEDVRKESQLRLVYFGGDELLTMTPQHGLRWTYREVWRRRAEPHVTAVQGDTLSNHTLDRGTVERLFASLSEEERAFRQRGEFVHVGGFAFPTLPDAVVDPPGPGHLKGQDVVVGVDPGVRWAGIVFLAFDTDNAAVVFDELLLRDATAETYVSEIRGVLEKWGIQGDPTFVIDPSARNRSLADAESVETELARFGVYCVPGFNDRQAGVLQIRRRLAHGSLQVSRDCRGLLSEADDYVLVERPDGSWEPSKGNDHRLDAMRYALMFRPWLAQPGELDGPRKRGFQPDWMPAFVPLPAVVEAPLGPYS